MTNLPKGFELRIRWVSNYSLEWYKGSWEFSVWKFNYSKSYASFNVRSDELASYQYYADSTRDMVRELDIADNQGLLQ